ncbi:hypothetical protein [Alicyclobacillus suci]|uniref:hypothetical protein n=1 Tax=Alicyclobacillus suci TaxID=2816080 RepID=UPI001A8D3D74|nr:hypothetical protein [Alicyclobacillus suci]
MSEVPDQIGSVLKYLDEQHKRHLEKDAQENGDGIMVSLEYLTALEEFASASLLPMAKSEAGISVPEATWHELIEKLQPIHDTWSRWEDEEWTECSG